MSSSGTPPWQGQRGKAVVDEAVALYVHVPFCQARCPYCDFNSVVLEQPPWGALQAALQAQLREQGAYFAAPLWRSLYFGGGTPSLAPASFLAGVKEAAGALRPFAPQAEITLEANPGTVTAAYLEQCLGVGINRLSLGWQSGQDAVLRTLGRRHDAAAGAHAFALARAAGFQNISIDIIFAVPGQSLAALAADLDVAVSMAPQHISVYGLTYYPGTVLHRWREAGLVQAMDEDTEAQMFNVVAERLEAAGYVHYEISNFARPGFEAVHNSSYWTGVPYLGLGPGAHSFNRRGWELGWRWQSTIDPAAYQEAWRTEKAPVPVREAGADLHPRGGLAPQAAAEVGGQAVAWVEELSAVQLASERMLCGLRLAEGVDVAAVRAGAAGSYDAVLQRGCAEALQRGLATWRGARLVPTSAGFRLGDTLAALF